MVDSIIGEAGGRVQVSSQVGEGSCFEIVLPRQEPLLAGRETVLVIEAREEQREVLAMLLETVGYEVLAAADPVAAVLHSESAGRAHAVIIGELEDQSEVTDLFDSASAPEPGPAVFDIEGESTDRDLLSRHRQWQNRLIIAPGDGASRRLLEALRRALDP